MKFGSRFRRLLSPAGRGQQSSSDPPDRGPSPSPSANTKKSLASREPSLRNDDALRAATPSEQSTEPFPTISATGSRTPEEGLPPRPVTLQARLWERAYEALRTEEEKVVARYEDLVADEAPPGSQGNWNQLEDVVRSGLQKTRKESEVYEKIHTGMDAISSIKGPLSTAAHSTHEGAAAYLVLLFGLEILSNPVTEQVANRKGITYVMQRIDMYWEMVDSYFRDEPASPSTSGHRDQLEKAFVELYQMLLLYQMKSVIRYRRHIIKRLPRDFVKLDDWDGQLDDIHKAEARFDTDCARYDASKSRLILEDISRTQQSQEDLECRRDLFETNPRNDKARIEDAKGGLRPEVFSWVLKNEGFQKWREDPEARLLWIKGDPGKGKTMLMCGIINKLNVDLHRDETRPLSFYFCEANDAARSSATSVLRGLICHLVDQNPVLLSHVREEHRRWGGKQFRDKNAWEVMKRILIAILNDEQLEETTLAVDALDECKTDLSKLLNLIADKTVLPRAKWVVSGRNWPQIEQPLDRVASKCKLSLELNEDAIFKAVSTYIDLQVEELADSQGYDVETRDAVQKYLNENAHTPHSTFLWVALICQGLAEAQVWEVEDTLNKYPPGLNAVYQRMMEHIRGSSSASLYIQILATMFAVYRPLALEELPVFIDGLEKFSDRVGTLTSIIGSCGSFLTVRAGSVYFVHQSAKDFLGASANLFPSGVKELHRTIYLRSLEAFLGEGSGSLRGRRRAAWALRRDPYGICKPGFPIEQVSVPDPDPIGPVRYSCAYWVDHLAESGRPVNSQDAAEGGPIDRFLKQKFHWVETLSLMRILPEGVLAIRRLDDITRKAGSPVADVAWDAYRFILYNREAVETTPLQVYMSALVFSPLRSKIRENFVDEAPQQYQPVSGVEETWGDRLHILRAQESDSVYTYAATNNMLASSTWEGTVRIWNPETGMCLQTIDHPVLKSNLPIWMVFSIDNKLLATVSPMVDNTEIHVWDPSTGEHLLTLNTKMAGMDSITFLNDNHRLAVIQHRFFTIWDTTTGERWKQIQLFELPKPFLKLNSAVIFQDGRAAVALPRPSAPSEDGSEEYCHPVWLWDSNHDLRILNGHDSRVYSLMFSADGGRLISAAGKTIKLWDSASGACLRTIDTSDPDRHGNCLMAVTQDNRIMWHNFKTLNLWDPATSTTDEIPMTHWRTVRCWADGQRIAAIRPFVVGGRRETIEILDGSVFTPAAKLRYEGLHADSHELYTPADGSVLLSRHNNIQTWQDIFLPWDPETGDCVDIMGAKLYDLRHILSGSNQLLGTNINRDNHGGVVVEVYKLEAVKHLRTFIGSWSTTRINSAAISSDGQKIVLGLYSGEVEVWDMATKTCARRIICTRVGSWQTGVRAVVCSQDDRLLVSASCERVENDKGLVMKVWDQDTSSCVGIVEETTVNANDVFPMAISTDGKILAVRVSRTEITVWHVHRKERLFTVSEFVQEPSTAYFVSTAPLRLQTNLGVWSIPPALLSGENGPVSAKEFEFYGYGVTADCSWIMKGREKIIWIPHDYRGPVVVTGSRVVIGLVKRVLMFHLPVDDVPP